MSVTRVALEEIPYPADSRTGATIGSARGHTLEFKASGLLRRATALRVGCPNSKRPALGRTAREQCAAEAADQTVSGEP